MPAAADLILGDFHHTVPGAIDRIGQPAALAHFDIGSEKPALDEALAASLSAAADPLVAPGGVVISDRAMSNPRWQPLPPPPGGSDGGHFMYRVEE